MSDVKMDITGQLADIVGAAGMIPAAELSQFAIEGVVPSAVVAPETVEQVAQVLAFANANGLSVIPWGGGTMMSVGGVAKAVDIVLSMSRLTKVLDYSPEDMTVTAQAGATLATLQTLLAGHSQMLPLDPPLPERATVGGILATNASGPLRYQFGMPRDFALGMVVVYADGTIAKAGGRTVKNVAGYDMTRLHIGAFGTLGVIVEATFKVAPLPKVMMTAAATFATLAAAMAAARAVRMARIVPWSLVLAPPAILSGRPDGYTVAVRLGGQAVVVAPQLQRALETLKEAQGSAVAEIDKAEDAFWPIVRDWPGAVGSSKGVLVRIGVAPSQAQTVLFATQDVAARNGVTASALVFPGAATILCHLSGGAEACIDAVAALLAVVRERNGNLVVESGPRLLKERMSVWGSAGADALAQRIKQTFDAKDVLNPGRFVGGL